MDGEEVLKELRRQESGLGLQTPVIIVTANSSAEDKQMYLENGFDGYLAKPVDSSLLEAEVLKFLPEELIEYQMNAEEYSTAAAISQMPLRRKHKKIQISTDCVSDLSRKYIGYYDLKVLYLYIETERGLFRDTLEIDADNLSRHLSHQGSRAVAVSAPVEDYEAFYSEALTEAEEVIHISMASGTGDSFERAARAAEGFDHVHVIDGGHISCGEGLLVLAASRLLRNGCNQVEELCQELEILKQQITTAFLMPDMQSFAASGYVGKRLASVFDILNLHPVLRMRQNSLKIAGFHTGNLDRAKKRFIHKLLRRKSRIDTRVVFISHAGCTIKQQEEFVNEILKYIPFENVIL